jgi:hypothetical protein
MNKRFKRFLKYGTSGEIELVMRWIFGFSIVYVLCYELWWYEVPASSLRVHRAGILTSIISYSTLVTCFFYYVTHHLSIVLPQKERKIKILANVFQEAVYIDWYFSRLRVNLCINGDQFSDPEKFRATLKTIKCNEPVSNFPHWYSFLEHLRKRIVALTRAISIHRDDLSAEFLQLVVLNCEIKSHVTVLNCLFFNQTIICSNPSPSLAPTFNEWNWC